MEWDKPVDKLTNQALAFETKASALKKHVLKHVYYTPEFEGAINTRARGEKEFEYAPLSRLFFEMTNGSFFEFRDSSTFLIYYGYYTLDVIAHDKTPSVEQACQDNFFQWSQFLGQEIEDVVIDWRSINYRHYRGKDVQQLGGDHITRYLPYLIKRFCRGLRDDEWKFTYLRYIHCVYIQALALIAGQSRHR